MRDILCRNFFRKYIVNPLESDEKAASMEKEVALEVQKLVDSMSDIPAPVLSRFENDLATKLGLMRKKQRYHGS